MTSHVMAITPRRCVSYQLCPIRWMTCRAMQYGRAWFNLRRHGTRGQMALLSRMGTAGLPARPLSGRGIAPGYVATATQACWCGNAPPAMSGVTTCVRFTTCALRTILASTAGFVTACRLLRLVGSVSSVSVLRRTLARTATRAAPQRRVLLVGLLRLMIQTFACVALRPNERGATRTPCVWMLVAGLPLFRRAHNSPKRRTSREHPSSTSAYRGRRRACMWFKMAQRQDTCRGASENRLGRGHV